MNDLIKSFLAGAILIVPLPTKAADTWQTVDDANSEWGTGASGGDIAASGTGILYTAGSVVGEQPQYANAIVQMSADGGLNWSSSDSYSEPGWDYAHFRAIQVGAPGRVFSGGELYNSVGPEKAWVVRESLDGGQTWQMADFFRLAAHSGNSCGDLKVNASGDVYATGFAADDLSWSWVVRKRAVGQTSFTTVDQYTPGFVPQGRMIAFHPAAGVFVAGYGGRDSAQWTVRKSSTGASGTWSTADAFAEDRWSPSYAEGMAIDPSGNIYVVGRAEQQMKLKKSTTQVMNWVVRRSVDKGVSWTVIDRFGALPEGQSISALTIAIDSAGIVFVGGYSNDTWLVRKGVPGAAGTVVWTTSDQYQLSAGQTARVNGMTVAPNGSVYAVGRAADAGGINHLIVRKLAR